MSSKIFFPYSVRGQTIIPQASAGHRLTAGLSLFNRAGRGTVSRIWLPNSAASNLQHASEHEFAADWVAIREVDIAQQYGNHMIYDMVMEEFNAMKWTHFDHSRMTDDGYRLIFVTMGVYESEDAVRGDELEIFDDRLRDRVQQLVSLMWDNERGTLVSDVLTRKLWFEGWNEKRLAADIGLMLSATEMFHSTPEKEWKSSTYWRHNSMDGWQKYDRAARKVNFDLTKKFLQVVGELRQEHFHSDQVLFGIEIPEFHKSNQWIYLAVDERKIYLFNNIISNLFGAFDMTTVHHLPTWRNRDRVRRIDPNQHVTGKSVA